MSPSSPPPQVVPPAQTTAPRTSYSYPRWEPPTYEIMYLAINPRQTHAGQPVTITTNVINRGSEAGSYRVAFKINGKVEQTRMVSVGPGATYPVKFTATKAQPGTYIVDIGGLKGSFIVTSTGSGLIKGMGDGPIVAAATAVFVLLLGLLIIVVRRRFLTY